jgi:hypothetical protein
MIPAEFLREYAQKTNTHRFEEVAPLTADNAVYWLWIISGKGCYQESI